MFSCNSESEESLENMKLDLIKAKYAYQKLKSTDSISKKKLNNENFVAGHNVTAVIDSKRHMKSPKISHSPKMRNKKYEIEYEVNKSYENSEDIDDEDKDLLKMNSYVDYLVNRKRFSMNTCTDESVNLNPIILNENNSALPNTQEAYQRNSSDDNQLNIPQSTDILVQWRLRRRMNEAQNSVKLEHQKHNMHIRSLNSQTINNQCLPVSFAYVQDNENVSDFNQVKYSVENEYDQVPVRDQTNMNDQVPKLVKPPEVVHSKTKQDASCQCNLDGDNKQSRKSDSNKILESSKNSKNFRNVAVMTRNKNKYKKFDGCTQTESNINNHNVIQQSAGLSDWDQIISYPDYIDMAIEKSVPSQLFERNYSSAMSVVTSINDSNPPDVVVQNSNQNQHTENDDKDLINIDTNSEEIPWNEHFQMMSDNEFQDDDVLVDLRRRRNLNLQKLRNLSLQIRDYQNCNVTPIKS